MLADFQAGKVDVLIGTHRVLSCDVIPKELGLVILDEEQRFGVAQKELLRALRLEPPWQDRILLDSGGYRALRIEELKMTARVAAERVQTSRQAFKLNPMTARERRIVHLALQEFPGVRTESIGMGEHRQVVIHPADEKTAR